MDWQKRVEQWAEDRNLVAGSNAKMQLSKLLEEVGELASAVAIGDISGIEDGIGDAAVVLCIMAKQCDLSFEDCLEVAWDDIKDRKGRIVDGLFVKE